MENRTDLFLKEVRECLTENILPYWLRLKDPRGGFYGKVAADGTVQYDAPRGVILNARLIWTFAAAYKALGNTEYLVAAMHARDWFLEHFCDHKWGGVYWSVSAEGERQDTKKQLYAQGINLYRVVETYFADAENGGYVEALARDFSPLEDMSLSAHDINADKTMNSHLHVLEAYANLYQVWPDEELRGRIVALLEIIGTRVMAPSGHLQLYFRRDWTVLPGGVSYGHDIETSWLAMECAFATRDLDVVSRVRPWALAMGKAGNEGLFADGSMRYEKLLDGTYDDSRQWWVQAETVVGNLWLWKFHGDAVAADRALAAWAYIREHLVDTAAGEWWWSILPDGSPDLSQPKAGFWKCPYAPPCRLCISEQTKLFRSPFMGVEKVFVCEA